MPVKKDAPDAVVEDAAVEVAEAAVNPLEQPGFHVVQGDTFLGTYETEADAQAFIDGHLKPQDLDGSIVEGPSA